MKYRARKTAVSGRLESAQALLALTFAAAIAVGTLLLMLPVSQTRDDVSLLDALFTTTSAVCVTGLTVVDTATRFTHFGQLVILLLIQAGGLGIMTFAALVLHISGQRMSLQADLAVQDSFFLEDVGNRYRQLLGGMVGLVFVVEAAGALLLWITTPSRGSLGLDLWAAVFHSVSAFCNAGFSVWTENLALLRTNAPARTVVMLLIVMGGLGHAVLIELWDRALARLGWRKLNRPRFMPLHVIVVLRATAILVFGGALALLAVDWLTESRGEHLDLLNALFQSVSARTAGYNSVNIGLLPLGSLTVLVGLMFIGGSPGSCAGGIKTTTAAVWLGKLRSRLLGRKEVSLMHHTVPDSVVHRAGLIIGLSVLWNVAGLLLLTLTEQGVADAHMEHLLFEQVSAFGTVGLSTGITPSLSAAGKLWIVATMFFGRVGPLTLATWMIHREMLKIRFPNGRIMIG